jgi:signal transduction histidine kinase
MAPFVAAALLHARLHASQRAAQERVQKNNSELETRVRERTVQIARAKEEWEKTFDAISEPISVQEGFVIRRANTAYAAQAGVRVQELVGKTCHLVLAGRDSPCTGCPLFEAAGSTHEVVMRGARLQVSAFESRLEGGMQGQVLAYRDVTVQRRLEERLKSTERLASLGQLASGAAHEINNPLAFLTSNLATLRAVVDERRQVEGGVSFEPADVTDVDEMLTDALNGARRISEIVRLLQTLSPHGASRLEDVEVEVPLQRAVERVFGPGSGVVLELAARRKVFTAPGRLEEALEHVLKNARQATAHPHQVTVATTVEGDDVVVRVKDSGVGISSEVLPHVFDPFFTTRKVGSGVGLGLTSTWGIVQQLGGRVAIHSEVGRGTTIELRLPLGAMQLGSASPAAVGRYAERAPKSEPAEQAPPTQSA